MLQWILRKYNKDKVQTYAVSLESVACKHWSLVGTLTAGDPTRPPVANFHLKLSVRLRASRRLAVIAGMLRVVAELHRISLRCRYDAHQSCKKDGNEQHNDSKRIQF